MAFNPSSYQGAISSQLKSRGALSRGMSSALSGQQKFKDFSLDEQNKYAKLQEKAGSVFSNWKRGLGLVAGLAATAMGLGPVAAGLMAGVSTVTGGAIGKGRAEKELGKSKYFKGITSDTSEAMGGTILKDSLLSAAMAYGAGTLREAGATAREAENLMDSDIGAVAEEMGLTKEQVQYDVAQAQTGADIAAKADLNPNFQFRGQMKSDELIRDAGSSAASKDFELAARKGNLSQDAIGQIEGFKTAGDDYIDYLKDVGIDSTEGAKDIASSYADAYKIPETAPQVEAFQGLKDMFRGGKLKYEAAVGEKGLFGDKAKGIFDTGTSIMNMYNTVNKGMNRRR